MNARRRILLLLAALLVGALVYYAFSADHSSDLQLQGTVDANQVIVGPQVSGRIRKLLVEEGQDVKAGELIALLDPEELAAGKAASDAQVLSAKAQAEALKATAGSTRGDTESAVASAVASASAARASLAEAAANRQNQELLTQRTVSLAEKGILSAQDRDTAIQTLKAVQARERAAQDQAAAAEAALKAAQARTAQARAAAENASAALNQWTQAQAQASAAGARLGYTRIVAPIAGKVGLWAAREGEVVNPGSAIVTIVDLAHTWVYAPVPETQADSVQLGDHLKVRMPSGAEVDGVIIAKSAEGEFATQRDVNHRKRDIKTVRFKLHTENPGERFVPGMTAVVVLPKGKLVRP